MQYTVKQWRIYVGSPRGGTSEICIHFQDPLEKRWISVTTHCWEFKVATHYSGGGKIVSGGPDSFCRNRYLQCHRCSVWVPSDLIDRRRIRMITVALSIAIVLHYEPTMTVAKWQCKILECTYILFSNFSFLSNANRRQQVIYEQAVYSSKGGSPTGHFFFLNKWY